ncbi:MAG: hypothetical protein L0G51_10515, partial [Lactococcus lactis]|nr:hypothetical protein [Lactococcus lactis]
LTLVIVLVTQSIYGKAIDDIGKNNIKTSSSSKSVKVPKHSTSKKKQTTLELLNQSASTSKSTDEIYVTGEITVGAVMLHIFVLSFSMETRSILATSLK